MLNGPVSSDEPPETPPAGEVPRPRSVDTAFQSSLAGTAVATVATVVTLMLDKEWLTHEVRDALTSAGMPDGDADVARMVPTFQVMLGFGIAVFAGLFLLFAMKMRAGRNWARGLLTAYACLGVVNFLTAVASVGAAMELMWSLAEVAFSVTAVVYMFRPESTKYFAEHRKRRLARRGGGFGS